MPEVSLVAILDADKEGFLRSERSLIQTIGRAARNINGTAILYADAPTDSMKRAIRETDRRRARQADYNREHGVTPRGIRKAVTDIMEGARQGPGASPRKFVETANAYIRDAALGREDLDARIAELERRMFKHADDLEFEEAARSATASSSCRRPASGLVAERGRRAHRPRRPHRPRRGPGGARSVTGRSP